MNSLLNSIDIMIKGAISEYNSKIAEKYSLNILELESLWNEVVQAPTPTPTPKTTIVKSQKKTEAKNTEEKTCPYSFTRGPNSGTVCGIKVKGESSYCSKHKQYEGKEQKQKKVLPQPKKPAQEDDNSEEEEKVRNEIKKKVFEGFSDEQVERMFIKKKELGDGLSYHKQTNLVCDNNKFIVGKKDGVKVNPLTEDDIKVAKSWNFKVKTMKEIIASAIENDSKMQETTTKAQEAKTQEAKTQETTAKAQEAKAQEAKTQEKKKPVLVSAKKFNIPVPQLNVKTIEREKLPVNEAPIVQSKKQPVTTRLNDEAKNTKRTITNLIEQQKQQKDVEDILEELTNGNESEKEGDEEMSGSELEEEDEIDIEGDYDEE